MFRESSPVVRLDFSDPPAPDPASTAADTGSAASPGKAGDSRKGGSEEGLRSTKGIRWLLAVGALVVAVSVLKLVADEWSGWPAAIKASVLIAGSLAVFLVGDVTRHRLRLHAAGSALLYLFAGLVPLLAWGAAYRGLLDETGGWLVVGVGFSALMVAVRRMLQRVLGYDGLLYPLAFGALLLAVPVVPRLWQLVGAVDVVPFALVSLGLGFAVRVAGRHINRFFFHRDRRGGGALLDHPVQLLPFGMLAVVYGLGMLELARTALAMPDIAATVSFVGLLAMPVVVLGVALLDMGDEVLQALARATGGSPARWPRRAVGLLACGFAFLGSGVVSSLVSSSGALVAMVTLVAGLRLMGWALSLHRPVAYGFGLVLLLVSYQSFPILIPEAWRAAGKTLIANLLGIASDSPGVLSFGQLFGLVALIGAAAWLRPRLGRSQMWVHGLVTALHGVVLMSVASIDVEAGRWQIPATVLVLAMGVWVVRRSVLLPAVYFGLFIGSLVWSASLGWLDRGIPAAQLALCVTFGYLLVTIAFRSSLGRRLDDPPRVIDRALVALPLVVAAVAACFGVGLISVDLVDAAVLLMLSGWIGLACAWLRRGAVEAMVGVVALIAAAHLAVADAGGGVAALSLVAQVTLVGFALSLRLLRVSPWLAEALRAGRAVGAVAGLVWLVLGVASGDVGPVLVHLVWIGLVALDLGLRTVEKRSFETSVAVRAESGRRAALPIGLGALALFVPCQLMALGWLGWVGGLLAAFAWLLVLSGSLGAMHARLAAFYEVSRERLAATLDRSFVELRWLWRIAAGVTALIWTGPAVLVSSLILAVELRRTLRQSDGALHGLAAGALLLPVLHLAALPAGTAGYLLPTLLEGGVWTLVLLSLGSIIWQLVITRFAAPEDAALTPWRTGIEVGMAGITAMVLAVGIESFALGTVASLWLLLGASLRVIWWIRHTLLGRPHGEVLMQTWLLLFAAIGARSIDASLAGLCGVLVALAFAERVLEGWLRRARQRPASLTCRAFAQAAALLGGWLAVVVAAVDPSLSPWTALLPAFAASVFFLLRAVAGEERVLHASLAAGTFLIALTALLARVGDVPAEMYLVGPGAILLVLSHLIGHELGAPWRGRLFVAGAVCLYAIPGIGLLDGLGWGWQMVLLVMSVAFGAASFRLRSPELLSVSTAALVIDLGCFVVRLHQASPLLLWVACLVFGLALMAVAGALEYRRVKVLQQLRIWQDAIRSWA